MDKLYISGSWVHTNSKKWNNEQIDRNDIEIWNWSTRVNGLELETKAMKGDWWFILTTMIDLLLCSIALANPSSLALAYADSPDTNAPQNRHGPSPSWAQIILPQLRQFPIKSCFWALTRYYILFGDEHVTQGIQRI